MRASNGNVNFQATEELIREYKRLYDEKIEAEKLFLYHQITLRDSYNASSLIISNTNLVILACKHNKVQNLEYILSTDKFITDLTIQNNDEDEVRHNAFYYAIRSNNIELLGTLINNWPDNYFVIHEEELEEILSMAYEELKLKNVPLSDEMEIFVENKLINLRFFSNTTGTVQKMSGNLDSTMKRIELVLQNISALKKDYSNQQKVDEKFLFIAKFIALNIHTLKRQLISTYVRLPWEEMEFCLVSFVFSHIKKQEITLFYRASLNKRKILKYLEHFAKKLEDEKDTIKTLNIEQLAKLPRLNRVNVLADIIKSYPQFQELYDDYQQIRDIRSLDKISDYITLASSANSEERHGQLIITRALQVTGEHLKNTLESPKLSINTSDLILLSLPKNTRKIFQNLRDTLSHADSLDKRIQIEENADINFFIKVQNDIKKVGDVIINILNNNKIKTVRKLLTKIVHCKNIDEIEEVTEGINTVELDEIISGNFKIMEHQKLEKLVKELSDTITDKTIEEKGFFNEIYNKLNCAGTQSKEIRTDFVLGVQSIQAFSSHLGFHKNFKNIKSIKEVNRTLEKIAPKIKPSNQKEITFLISQIYHSLKLKIQSVGYNKLLYLMFEILLIVNLETCNIKWIEDLTEKLNKNDLLISISKQPANSKELEDKYYKHLEIKLSELKSILPNISLNSLLIESDKSLYRNDKKLQAVVEMLILDISSILDSPKLQYLEQNSLFLDGNTPLLVGKCLRNYLAHDNTVVDLLLSDSSRAVILNAEKLTKENITTSKKNIGKLVNDDPFKLKVKYDRGLLTVNNTEKMFAAFEEGNLENLKYCLRNGTDVYARSTINLWTTLHFAAKGPSLEFVKFILAQNININGKDIGGCTPLHIAAAHGRTNTVEFLVKQSGVLVDVLNNEFKTPLHLAVQNNQKDTVEVLLKNIANTVIPDIFGLPSLHYAIQFNYMEIARILLAREINVDINESLGGVTPLHRSAGNGYLEIVQFLLQNKADVNVKTDHNSTPLHLASTHGFEEVANALICKGANINARFINGYTPLHYAATNGHEKIVNILLKHGANVNAVERTFHITSLHEAARCGREKIVKVLLKNNARANVTTMRGKTPLHFAVTSSNLETVAVLLNHGINVNAKDNDNNTPLHHAANSGHKEIVQLLINNNADINAKDNNNLTPLFLAAMSDYKDVTELLISYKAEVNAKDSIGRTPLCYAVVENGSKDIIDFLIKNNAEVNVRSNIGRTPLHEASLRGRTDAINCLIRHEAEVNATDYYGHTPLHFVAKKGHKDVVKLLIKNKGKIHVSDIANTTPLQCAIISGHKEIVEILLKNGANVHEKCIIPAAIVAGYRDIIDILLSNKACVNVRYVQNYTPLHYAAERGHKQIANTLIRKGADINAIDISNATPLHLAALEGHEDVIEILISNGAKVDVKTNEDISPLLAAIENGHNFAVKVLLENQEHINIEPNRNNMTPIKLAVLRGNLQVVKMLLHYNILHMNVKYYNESAILHIASQQSNLEVVKYLVDKGADIYARNASGSMPIHIAIEEGHKDIVDFFLSEGFSINHSSAGNPPLLHYTARKGNLEILKHLILHGADVNVKDNNGLTPMHVAAECNKKGVIEVLLKNCAVYNAADKLHRTPIKMTKDKDIRFLLASTEKMFEAVKRNNLTVVENFITSKSFINAKDTDNLTPLHYAAWKGHIEIVNILLKNEANPNVVGNKGLTALHYAASFSHFKIVNALLSKYAVYNALSDSGKTPSNLAVDESIINLFKLVDDLFNNIKHVNSEVVNVIKNINDFDTARAVMNARNRENKTLVVFAMISNFPKVNQLIQIFPRSISDLIDLAKEHYNQSNYEMALNYFNTVIKKRKDFLGSDDPGTLHIQTYIGRIFHLQGDYQKALNVFEEIFQKQKEILGLNYPNTLNTRAFIAVELYNQGKNKEALKIYQEVYQQQKKILGLNHCDTLNTELCMSLVLHRIGKYEEALSFNKIVLERTKEFSDANNSIAMRAQGNIALILTSQGKYDKALKIYELVLEENKRIFGINHTVTLTTSSYIANIFLMQRKHCEALKAFQQILKIQKMVLTPNNSEIWDTKLNMTNVLISQGKYIGALRVCVVDLDIAKTIWEPSHIVVSNISKQIERLDLLLKNESTSVSEIIRFLQKDINVAASDGNVQIIQGLLEGGDDVNDKDIYGRTPLHYAANNGHINIVNILLINGADVTKTTHKGNTPLHIATLKDYKEIVEVLLQHESQSDFINAKATISGSTSLHVAAKNGFLDVAKSLLKRGAAYNVEDNKGQIPIDLSKDPKVTGLLKLIEELFKYARNGNNEVITKLRALKSDEFIAVTNARNNKGHTLLQVSSNLSKILQNPNHNK